jgi:hypothetical protein
MRSLLKTMCVAAALVVGAGITDAVANSDDGHDVITVVANGRHAMFPTATCTVWANAEGFGVGPATLGGYGGVVMMINLHPLQTEGPEHPTSFADGLRALKTQFPTAPAWLLNTIEKNRVGIETACAQDHVEPFKIHTITAKDKRP